MNSCPKINIFLNKNFLYYSSDTIASVFFVFCFFLFVCLFVFYFCFLFVVVFFFVFVLYFVLCFVLFCFLFCFVLFCFLCPNGQSWNRFHVFSVASSEAILNFKMTVMF